MRWFLRHRWGDNDRHFGPFTYAHAGKKGYRSLAMVLGSGDGDEHPGCTFRISGFGHTLIIALFPLIWPHRKKVFPKSWSEETIKRLGRNWYWDTTRREYGFSYSEGFFHLLFGVQTGDSRTTQDWGMFLPWTQLRHVRTSLYGLYGEHYWSEHTKTTRGEIATDRYERQRIAEETCPARTFLFTDYDGEQIAARTIIEELEWRQGEGWFKWLSLFYAPKIRRSLDIKYSSETGPRKGSYKGGVIGHGIEMLPGELHEETFRRYCLKNNMVFDERFSRIVDDWARTNWKDLVRVFDYGDIAVNPQTYKVNLAAMGFEEVLSDTSCYHHDVSGALKNETLYLYGHRRDGLLLQFNVFNDKTIHRSILYYNWRSHGSLRAISNGHMKDDVWIGRHDIDHKTLRIKLDSLRASGTFVTPWIQSPAIHLTHSMVSGNGDHRILAARRLTQLPDWVKEFMNTSRVDTTESQT